MLNMNRILEDVEAIKEKGQKLATSDPWNHNSKLNVDLYLSEYGIAVKRKERQVDRIIYILDHCLFDESHTGKDAAIIQYNNGALTYHCFHDSCADKTWKDARRVISGDEPLTNSSAKFTEPHIEKNPEEQGNIDPLLEYAQSLYSYQTRFPWQIFPTSIANSLLACAESCATSPTALAGVAFAILSSTLGRTVSISPKKSWVEPLHVWFADIRPSGEGKTPAMQLLARVLHEAQAKTDRDFEIQKNIWETTPRKERGEEPRWSRSYFVSGLTLEGIRSALQQGHGGITCLLNELSSFITGQGQYKSGKGDDREAWLALHDGSPARIVRAGSSVTIQGARISICGGIQPEVFRSVFGDKGGLFLTDGTIFRFLLTYEPAGHFELTRATWNNHHRAAWEELINKALQWADDKFKSEDDFLVLKLSDEAWNYFLDFRNNIYSMRDHFPPAFRGFIPKAVSYVLRISGLLHVMEQFFSGDDILPVVDVGTIQKAILAVNFYMGHTLEALKLLHGQKTMIQFVDQKECIVAILESLSPKEETRGFITVKQIAESYNEVTGGNVNSRKMGDILLKNGLPTVDVPGHCRGVFIPEIKNFLKRHPRHPRHPQSKEYQDVTLGMSENGHPRRPREDNPFRDVRDIPETTSPTESLNIADVRDIRDIRDVVSKQNEIYKVDCPVEVLP